MPKQVQSAKETDYPEVISFIEAQTALQEFRQAYPEFFEQLDVLVDQYNTTLESAEKTCRNEQVKCGPFDLYQFTTKYNAEALFNAVGRDKFLELGGTTGSEVTYSIDKARFEAAVAAKKVSKEIVDTVRKEAPVFHTPKRLVLP